MKQVKVGVGVFIRRANKILLGKRKGNHGNGDWCAPGGHLEYGETFEEAAAREALEESGMHITNIAVAMITHDIFPDKEVHYVTINMVADAVEGEEAQLMEPEKCEKWEWFTWDKLPEPLFLSEKNLLKQGFDPFKM